MACSSTTGVHLRSPALGHHPVVPGQLSGGLGTAPRGCPPVPTQGRVRALPSSNGRACWPSSTRCELALPDCSQASLSFPPFPATKGRSSGSKAHPPAHLRYSGKIALRGLLFAGPNLLALCTRFHSQQTSVWSSGTSRLFDPLAASCSSSGAAPTYVAQPQAGHGWRLAPVGGNLGSGPGCGGLEVGELLPIPPAAGR